MTDLSWDDITDTQPTNSSHAGLSWDDVSKQPQQPLRPKRGRPRKEGQRWNNGQLKRRRRALDKRFIAIDGEGEERYGLEEKHSYSLLAAVDDAGNKWNCHTPNNDFYFVEKETFLNENGETHGQPANYGNSTLENLDFILNLPEGNIFAFAFSYDVSMIIRDLPKQLKKELLYGENKSIEWYGYKLEYIPRKQFSVKFGKSFTDKGKLQWDQSRCIWDVFTFFQKGFVSVLNDWEIGTQEQRDRIQAMKEQRGEFENLTDSQVLEYCYEECELLIETMRKFLHHIERLDLTLTRYDGPGNLAASWMKKHKILDYKADTNLDEHIALSAYYGGRFEISDIGYHAQLESYDINSAYPKAITELPCLAHGQWIYTTKHHPGKVAVYRVSSLTEGTWAPFPWRDSHGNVFYAHSGNEEGWRWIWCHEVDIAIKHYGKKKIVIHEGYVWIPECEHQPFSEVQELYDYRYKLKEQNDMAEKCIKLLINSLYGKMAQSVGYRRNAQTGELEKPTFQSFIWAGLITSYTRAQILDSLCQINNNVVSIATDGILCHEHIPTLTISKKLGEWEHTSYRDVYLFQSGIYTGINQYTNKRVYKTRGYGPKDFPVEKLIEAWDNREIRLTTNGVESPPYTRFIGVKSALLRKNWIDLEGQWEEQTRKINFHPPRRVCKDNFEEYEHDHTYDDIWPTQPCIIYEPSTAFKKKDKRTDLDQRNWDDHDQTSRDEQPI